MSRIADYLSSLRREKPGFDTPPAPERDFVAIGDVHGCDGLLAQLLDRVEHEAPGLPVIFVGDYVDRGPDSAGVLARIMELTRSGAVGLRGNHEAMMLDFVDMPARAGPQWLMNGGVQTLESFGVPAPADPWDDNALTDARDALIDRAGPALIAWLRERPLIWQSGNVAVTHAGGDPSSPLEPRRGHGLLWGHPDFWRKRRKDGLWMVHGHYIVAAPGMRDGRISIDTGAFHTHRLTAAIVTRGDVRFVST